MLTLSASIVVSVARCNVVCCGRKLWELSLLAKVGGGSYLYLFGGSKDSVENTSHFGHERF